VSLRDAAVTTAEATRSSWVAGAPPSGTCTLTITSSEAEGMFAVSKFEGRVVAHLIDAESSESLSGAGTPEAPKFQTDLDLQVSIH